MGLAGYRSYLIISGVVEVDSTTADSLLSKGVILTMFISFVVPVSHSALGFIAVPRFLAPIVNYIPRFIGGMSMFIWSWFMRFFFGFQNFDILPAVISNLRDSVLALKVRIQKTDDEVRKQQKIRAELNELQAPFSAVQEQAKAISGESAAIREEWKAKSAEFSRQLKLQPLDTPALADISDKERQASITGDLTTYGADVKRRAMNRILEAKRLLGQLADLPKRDQKWREKRDELTKTLPALMAELGNERKDVAELRAEREACYEILNPRAVAGPAAPEAPTDVFKLQLYALRSRGLQPGLSRAEISRIALTLTACKKRLDQAKNDLDAADGKISALELAVTPLNNSLADIVEPPRLPPESEIAAVKQTLASVPKDLMEASDKVSSDVKIFVKTRVILIGSKEKEKEKGKEKEKVKKPPNRFFAWIQRVFNDILDGIMGASDPKKAKASDAAPPPAEALAVAAPAPGQAAVVAPAVAAAPAAVAAAAGSTGVGPVAEGSENPSVKFTEGGMIQ